MSGTTGPTAISATIRAKQGKGASRQARLAGSVPAVIYGMKKDPLAVTVDPRELAKAVTGPLRRNAVLTLNLKDAAGKAQGARHVLVRELQIHPVRRTPSHVDFLELDPKVPALMKVPLEVTGKSKAVADGAKLQLVVRTINVSVVPTEVPEKLLLDVTGQGFGVMRAKSLTMPKGVTLLDSIEMPIVSVRMPRGDKEEEAAAAAAAAAPAEGAAPAAGAADAKAGAAAAPAAGKDAPKSDDKGKKK
ncbi:MAG: 50S ribosomal protein L25 [Deltaproteobacteria bacterium]|nr:50S ribosomal protein L25 [Deltaproteobacteria bacterium]